MKLSRVKMILFAPLLFATVLSGAEISAPDNSPIFVWYHHTSREYAKRVLVAELERRGIANEVRWKDYRGSVSIALGIVLAMRGYISDDEIVIEKCGGTLSERTLSEIRRVLRSLFPDGSGYEQIKADD